MYLRIILFLYVIAEIRQDEVIFGGSLTLTRTWIQATDSDGVRLTVQTQADGVVSGVAQSLPLLRPITTCH